MYKYKCYAVVLYKIGVLWGVCRVHTTCIQFPFVVGPSLKTTGRIRDMDKETVNRGRLRSSKL